MFNLYRVSAYSIRLIATFATEQELYNYCKARRWISYIDKPEPRVLSIMEYPDGFECEVWYDEDLHAGRG